VGNGVERIKEDIVERTRFGPEEAYIVTGVSGGEGEKGAQGSASAGDDKKRCRFLF
jgi:hypothetical protein